MFLIVGLGNPGAEYAKTRHNVGFMAVDVIHDEYGFGAYKSHDDLDLKINQIKAKLGGGAGGHNGLKSIDAAITPNYNRIRLGIGHPDNGLPHEAVINHVLTGFSKADMAVLEHNISLVSDQIGVLIKDGVAAFSNKIGNLNKPSAN